MINYKQILEAVNRGIKFALSDLEDDGKLSSVSKQKIGQIVNNNSTKDLLKWKQLIAKLKNKKLSKQELEELVRLTKLSGLKYTVNSKDELKIIIRYIIKDIDSKANLNWIDTSKITNMDYLFIESQFNGNISEWDVSNVESMYRMFARSKFNGDISKWNVSKVNDMRYMFWECPFNHNISMWNVWRPNKDDLIKTGIFAGCPINSEYQPIFNNE